MMSRSIIRSIPQYNSGGPSKVTMLDTTPLNQMFIHDWLDSTSDLFEIQYLDDSEQLHSTKHNIEINHYPPSTPLTMSLHTPKKRRTNNITDQEGFNDRTPRAQRSSIFPDDSSDAHSLSSVSQSESHRSGRSSPSKSLQLLSLSPDGLRRIPMDIRNPAMPPELADFVAEMQGIGLASQVVPHGLKPKIDKLKTLGLDADRRMYRQFFDTVYTSGDDLLQGQDALLDGVLKTVALAMECDETCQDETGWNHLVHSPLLDQVLDRQPQNLVGFMPCMTANINDSYRMPKAPGARVDYVMFINPSKDSNPDVPETIRKFQREMPDASINHTDFTPLQNRPIGVSIETKRQHGPGLKASLQIGVWQGAQWKLLGDRAAKSIEELPFIPGVVVEGHNWNFVATTHLGDMTTLWTSQLFGNTMSPLGTFQVIAGLSRLRKWLNEVYWPWYKRRILGIEPTMST